MTVLEHVDRNAVTEVKVIKTLYCRHCNRGHDVSNLTSKQIVAEG